MQPVVAVFDACVLYPSFLRDFLIRLAIHGRRQGWLRAKWTGRIHREWVRAVLENRPDIPRAKLLRTCRLMDQHVRGCRVHGYQRWEQRLTLPDENDRHVLAAAIACAADVIVTFNTKDFPFSVLGPFGVAAVLPDTFVFEFGSSGLTATAAAEHRASLHQPPMSAKEYLDAMRRNRLEKTALWLEDEGEFGTG